MAPPDLRALVAAARAAPLADGLRDRLPSLLELDARGSGLDALLEKALAAWQGGAAGLCVDAVAVDYLRRALPDALPALAVTLNVEGGDDIAAIAAAAAACAGDGVEAIEVTVPLIAIEDGDVGLVGDLIEACRTSAGPAIVIRAMMPAQAIDASLMTGIARTAVMSGAHQLALASSGSAEVPDLDALALLLSVVQEAEGRIGLKTPVTEESAAPTLALVAAMLGPAWIAPDNLRLETGQLMTPGDP